MQGNIVGATKLNAQIQIPPLKYVNESKLKKLKQGNGWSVTKGARRGRLEILAEILLFCEHQKAKTSIMHKTNLNYAQLKSHLKFLTAQRMLMYDTKKYSTTEKGYRFLELFAELNDILRD
jgi:predicted transcriptional regulator